MVDEVQMSEWCTGNRAVSLEKQGENMACGKSDTYPQLRAEREE